MKMSQITKNASGGGGSGITTINGDSGSITGSNVTIFANRATSNCGLTVGFDNSGTTSTLNVTDVDGNTHIGFNAGAPGGNRNTSLGSGAMDNAATTAEANTAIGQGSLSVVSGDLNVGVGLNAGFGLSAGDGNTFIGAQCAETTVSSTNNTAIGWMAMQASSGSQSNVALGVSALLNIQSSNNVSAGQSSMQSATSSSNNVSIGSLAMFGESSGSNNTVVGHIGMRFTSGANNNVVLGYQAGTGYTGTESSNIVIGSDVLGTAGDNNWVRIGNQGSGTSQQDKCAIAGIFGATVTGSAVLCDSNGVLGTVVSSQRYKENVGMIAKDVSVLKLQPVQFNYKKDPDKKTQYGLIAEDVHDSFPYLCVYDNEQKPESVKYHELPTLLLLEIQRLNQRIQVLESKLV